MTDTETELSALLLELLEIQAQIAELEAQDSTESEQFAASMAEANSLIDCGAAARFAGDTVRDPE